MFLDEIWGWLKVSKVWRNLVRIWGDFGWFFEGFFFGCDLEREVSFYLGRDMRGQFCNVWRLMKASKVVAFSSSICLENACFYRPNLAKISNLVDHPNLAISSFFSQVKVRLDCLHLMHNCPELCAPILVHNCIIIVPKHRSVQHSMWPGQNSSLFSLNKFK